ncbi:uncharacterized protein [Oryctolagus cuniculus]|uniref:uncharacterized protein n=1 Tax=Oryctolagus cuniculus TaxID=9986 RepID=UPI00222EDDAD|nr:uncharacterized protein LOC127489310 [Oryctolagus cuniculus]XP_051696541.1 uncharacterized protein LOC127489310 [Oryctolagus cuniculus]
MGPAWAPSTGLPTKGRTVQPPWALRGHPAQVSPPRAGQCSVQPPWALRGHPAQVSPHCTRDSAVCSPRGPCVGTQHRSPHQGQDSAAPVGPAWAPSTGLPTKGRTVQCAAPVGSAWAPSTGLPTLHQGQCSVQPPWALRGHPAQVSPHCTRDSAVCSPRGPCVGTQHRSPHQGQDSAVCSPRGLCVGTQHRSPHTAPGTVQCAAPVGSAWAPSTGLPTLHQGQLRVNEVRPCCQEPPAAHNSTGATLNAPGPGARLGAVGEQGRERKRGSCVGRAPVQGSGGERAGLRTIPRPRWRCRVVGEEASRRRWPLSES